MTSGASRKCVVCKETKPIEEFPLKNTYTKNRHSWCRKCKNDKDRERRKNS